MHDFADEFLPQIPSYPESGNYGELEWLKKGFIIGYPKNGAMGHISFEIPMNKDRPA